MNEEPSNINIDSNKKISVGILNKDENITTKSQVKAKLKSQKKSNKKLTKAISVLKFHEGGGTDDSKNHESMKTILSEIPTNKYWIYHFGNGDEDDQVSLKKYFENKFGKGCKIYVFPGITYGFLELNGNSEIYDLKEDKENPKETLINHNFNLIDKNIYYAEFEISFTSGTRNVFLFYSSILLKDVNENNTSKFPTATYNVEIPGLFIIDEFISPDEENILINSIDKRLWNKLSNRKVQHYGYEFIYGANNINKYNKIGELPEFDIDLKKNTSLKGEIYKFNKNFENKIIKENENLNEKLNLNKDTDNVTESHNTKLTENSSANSFFEKFGNFDQLTINDYKPGDGIPPHIDSHSPFEDVFCSLSLLSGVVMTFTSPITYESKHLYLKPRSLAIFSGEVRYIWDHSISLRKIDKVQDNIIFRNRRVSLTFRKIREGECACPYIQYCDSQKKKLTKVSAVEDYLSLNKDITSQLNGISSQSGKPTEIEKKHVYDVYEKIAPHFSHTRYKPWPKVAEFLDSLEPGSFNIDVGCGNGKYLNVNEKIFTVGTDRCFKLIEICREKNSSNQLFVSDSLQLPLREGIFDSAISIAVVHHFSNVDLRIKALQELIRVLKIGGKLLIYVWALEQDDKKFKQQDNFVPWHLQSNYENTDCQIESLGPEIIKEEKKNSTVYHRYYHMFKQGELEEVINSLNNVNIINSYYDRENWCCIVEKKFN